MQVGEVRNIAADRLWLSGAYGEDAVVFQFTRLFVFVALRRELDPSGKFGNDFLDRCLGS